MRKAPFRATNEISQQYNDGVVEIYAVTDSSQPGYQPKEEPTLKYSLAFEERALGINRLYLSRQNHAEIKRVIRVQRVSISPQDLAITNDEKQYRVDAVQAVLGVYPPSLDLSLVAVEQNFKVMPQ